MCLKPEAQIKLMKFQFDKYGRHLEIPPMPEHTHIDTELESPEEIAMIMKLKPHRLRRSG